MEITLNAPKIWLASEPVDFRKAMDGLAEVLASTFHQPLGPDVVVFYNRARNKLKLLAKHRLGCVMIYKRLDRGRFTVLKNQQGLYALTPRQLSWLLAGLDWQAMTDSETLAFDDYF